VRLISTILTLSLVGHLALEEFRSTADDLNAKGRQVYYPAELNLCNHQLSQNDGDPNIFVWVQAS